MTKLTKEIKEKNQQAIKNQQQKNQNAKIELQDLLNELLKIDLTKFEFCTDYNAKMNTKQNLQAIQTIHRIAITDFLAEPKKIKTTKTYLNYLKQYKITQTDLLKALAKNKILITAKTLPELQNIYKILFN